MGAAVAHAAFRESYVKALRMRRLVAVLAVRFEFVRQFVAPRACQVFVLCGGGSEKRRLYLVAGFAVFRRHAAIKITNLRQVSAMASIARVGNPRMRFVALDALRNFTVDVMASGTVKG